MADVTWWQRGIVYQIYPRSFQDSNGDGIGDLKGINARLDYLVWLGVDAIWISPIYPSPMADFGYDISDYRGVDPIFGTLDDAKALIQAVHERGLKIILDFVPNHTSDQHPWFKESRSSRTNDKRDWYIWRDPKPDGLPPNNWISNFGGSAWSLDQTTGQYYLHSFLRQQPDLNWRNPDVRAQMNDALRFWLKLGVDGFRVDVIWLMIKDAQFRDNPPDPTFQPHQAEIHRFVQVWNADQPEVHGVISEMRKTVEEFPERVLIGEIYLPLERLVTYYGTEQLEGVHLPFNFQLIHTAWNARAISNLVHEYEKALPSGGWPNWVLGNHDQTRIAARVGAAQARIAAILLLTLRGTPTMYYGDELGIGKVEIPPYAVQDPWEKNEPGLGLGRDPQRTPMQWDGSPNAGFTTGKPWLPLSHEYAECHVARLKDISSSILSLYRRLIDFRRRHSALSVGDYYPVTTDGDVLVYERRSGNERLIVALNLGHQERCLSLPSNVKSLDVLLSTHEGLKGAVTDICLHSDEGIIGLVTS
jgi:alpha-glucosidase